MEFTKSLQDSLFIASIFIAALFIICTVSLALRNYEIRHELKKLKKWRKFSEIEKAQKHEEYDRLATELAEERAFNDTQGEIHVNLMLKYAGIQEANDKTKLEYDQLKRHYAETTRRLEVSEKLVKVAETEITELKSKLSRKNLKRDEKGRVLPKPARDWTTATKDELLAEVKRRYPVGTRVKCLHNTGFDLIETDIFKYDKYGSCMRHENKKGYVNCVYEHGKWAQIIPNA